MLAAVTAKGRVTACVTRSGKQVAVFGGKALGLVEVERKSREPKPKKRGRPKYVPAPWPSMEKNRHQKQEIDLEASYSIAGN